MTQQQLEILTLIATFATILSGFEPMIKFVKWIISKLRKKDNTPQNLPSTTNVQNAQKITNNIYQIKNTKVHLLNSSEKENYYFKLKLWGVLSNCILLGIIFYSAFQNLGVFEWGKQSSVLYYLSDINGLEILQQYFIQTLITALKILLPSFAVIGVVGFLQTISFSKQVDALLNRCLFLLNILFPLLFFYNISTADSINIAKTIVSTSFANNVDNFSNIKTVYLYIFLLFSNIVFVFAYPIEAIKIMTVGELYTDNLKTIFYRRLGKVFLILIPMLSYFLTK
ncbi:hypothetical protein D922_01828 [Enterococcus faecalis 06-MB-DW-09]|nr:hypothetical protein D922_01828 [Enterococcus faecalis 06-MB-DW-09]